jgi:hypothetical protein
MKYLALVAAVVIVSFIFLYKNVEARDTKRRILLLGASVGDGWSLPDWHKRINDSRFIVEMNAEYLFDKRNTDEAKEKIPFDENVSQRIFQARARETGCNNSQRVRRLFSG